MILPLSRGQKVVAWLSLAVILAWMALGILAITVILTH